MKGVSEPQMKMMLKAAGVVQGGVRLYQRAKQLLLSRAVLVISLAVVLLAVVLRYLGLM